MKPKRRKPDKTQYRRRPKTAFKPVHRIIPKMGPGIRQTHKQKGRCPARANRHRTQRSLIGFFKNFRIDLGNNPGIGDGDRQHTGQRRQPKHLQKDQCPEQFMDRTNESTADPNSPAVKYKRQAEPKDVGQCDAKQRERKRIGKCQAQTVGCIEIRCNDSFEQQPEFPPRIGRRDCNICKYPADDRDEQKPPGRSRKRRRFAARDHSTPFRYRLSRSPGVIPADS